MGFYILGNWRDRKITNTMTNGDILIEKSISSEEGGNEGNEMRTN